MKHSGFTATGDLLKNYLRGSKAITLLLAFLPFLFAYGAAASNKALLSTPALLSDYILQNQGNALLGAIAANTLEAATVWRIRIAAAVISSVFSIVLVVNNTRKDEEQGRLELLRSGAVGTKAPLCAALIKVFGANFLDGLILAAGFIAAGFPAAGSFTAGFATALCGCCFAAITGICAQIAPNARMARGLAFGSIAFFMVLQVIANALESVFLLLFTPLGWCAYSRAYAGENPRFFLFAALVIASLTLIAFVLSERRDMGGSYVQERIGRATAGKGFNTPLALAWRLQRSMFIVWMTAYALMGLVIASLQPSINEMLGDTNFLPELSAVVGGAGRAFLAILSYILTQVVTAYTIMAILRIREEESLNRAEIILSVSASRTRYAGGHLLIAFAGSAAAIAAFGVLTGEIASCAARIPAIWVVASVTVLVYGISPRAAAPTGWGLFGALLIMEFLWELRFIDNNVFKISPFAWVYPGVTVSAGTVLVMLILAAALIGLGLVCFSRRDLQ